MKRPFETIQGIPFCRWQDCRDSTMRCSSARRVSSQWLQNLKGDSVAMSELRRGVARNDLGHDLSRLEDAEIISLFDLLLSQRRLRRCGDIKSGPVGLQTPVLDRPRNAADRIVRTLTGVNRSWSLDGQKLLVIRADQWRRMREDGRYQTVPIDEARRMIPRLAATLAATAEEKSAWQDTVDMLAGPGSVRLDASLLLVRIAPRRNFKTPSTEPAITPSQFAKLVADTVIEKVKPEILADFQQLDTADDGFVHEEEPSGDEEGVGAGSPDDPGDSV